MEIGFGRSDEESGGDLAVGMSFLMRGGRESCLVTVQSGRRRFVDRESNAGVGLSTENKVVHGGIQRSLSNRRRGYGREFRDRSERRTRREDEIGSGFVLTFRWVRFVLSQCIFDST